MTDEDAFQAALDADPGDHTARLVFADWLDERGDPRGPGYRALGRLGRRPLPDLRENTTRQTWVRGMWFYHTDEPHHRAVVLESFPEVATAENELPEAWVRAAVRLGGGEPATPRANLIWVGYVPTRREAEDFAALAFAALPPGVRAEYLAGPG